MNRCCRMTLQALQDRLANTAEALLKAAGDSESVMSVALRRRAEVIVDVMATVKEFAVELEKV